ncbi:MAG: PQQ-binding-like beta-propeller repeat protein [Bryobacteraceae bacterium]
MRLSPSFVRIAACLGTVALPSLAADWLSARNDAEGTGWQRYGTSISTRSAHDLKLLWKLKLDNQSHGANSLTVPTMLGPIITHRGIKELILIAGASGNLFAVDADKGIIFWKRDFTDTSGQPDTCGKGLTATPAIAPQRPGTKIRSEDDMDGGSTPLRPFYLVSSDGLLHTVRPSDGLEMALIRRFAPAHANLSALSLSGGVLSATTSAGCGGVKDGEWSLDVANADAKPAFKAANSSEPASSATWTDSDGVRWTYQPAGNGVIEARRNGQSAWVSSDLGAQPLPPVIVNGVVLVLTTQATLYAFDGRTGKQLYSSGNAIRGTVDSSGLAVANGHISFGTSDSTLYCFGFPIEM